MILIAVDADLHFNYDAFATVNEPVGVHSVNKLQGQVVCS